MTNIEKMRAAIKARNEAAAEIARLERETGMDSELADMSDDAIRAICERNREMCRKLPARGSMSVEKSVYRQMSRELNARAGLLEG